VQLAGHHDGWLQRVGNLIKDGAEPSGIIEWHSRLLPKARRA
jgi:hypothetical protein